MTNMAAEKDTDARLRTVANGNGSAPTLDDKSSIGQTTLCSEDKLELRRTVGLVGGVSLIVGTMIGEQSARRTSNPFTFGTYTKSD